MKLLYICFFDFSLLRRQGIVNKIQGQKAAFEKNGINVDLLYMKDNNFFLNEKMFGINNKIDKYIYGYRNIYTFIQKSDYNFIYIRKPNFNEYFLHFLRSLRRKSNVKIFLEIPTYPYYREGVTIKSKIKFAIDKFYSKKLKYYIDFIVTFSNHNRIFDIDTIKISNGINIEKIPVKKIKNKKNTILDLIGVANINKWHGYDRLIKGLYLYYKTNPLKKVNFHIVGEGIELSNLKRLSKNLGMERYVVFHGFKKGKELDELFDLSDVAIGSLGLHRKGLVKESSLKNREYCARGIPFIVSSIDDDFRNFNYVYHERCNENPLQITKIIEFYERIKNKKNYIIEMRKYAENYLTWEVKMEPVINKINTLKV